MTTYICKACKCELDSSRFRWQRQHKNGKLYRLHTCRQCQSRRDYANRRNDPDRYARFLAYQRQRYKQGKRMRREHRSTKRKELANVLAKHGLNKEA